MATILLDCDDVLLNWAGGFREYLQKTRGVETNGPRPCNWDMQAWTGMEHDAIHEAISEFNERSQDFAYLEPIPGAEEAIAHFVNEGHELIVITSCSEDPACVARRRQNLIDVFGDVFSEIHCLSRKMSKFDVLAGYPPSLWVEDNYDNACIGRDAGHQAVLLEYPHNTDFKGEAPSEVIWHDDWTELLPAMQATLQVRSMPNSWA